MSDVQQALETIFSADSALYRERGFQRRIGFGSRPALIHIDLANAWTRPGNAFSCDGMDTIIPGVQQLNEAARPKGIPIVYTTTAYAVTEGPSSDMGLWHHKIPVEVLQLGTDAVAIDERIAPEPGEHVIEFALSEAVPEGLADGLRALGGVTAVRPGNGGFSLTVTELHRTLPALLAFLQQRALELSSLTTHHATLDDVFLHLTGRALTPDTPENANAAKEAS